MITVTTKLTLTKVIAAKYTVLFKINKQIRLCTNEITDLLRINNTDYTVF